MTKILWRNKKHPIIGVTGGIATGKSTVVAHFRRAGAKVIDADKIAREVVRKDSPVYAKIVREFKTDILKKDKTLDRKKLGEIIFNDQADKRKLERITHPAIIKRIKEKVAVYAAYSAEKKPVVVVIDAPLLFEAGLEKLVDVVALVYLPYRVQLARLMKRDKLPGDQAAAMISSQMPLSKKRKMSDFVIDNSLPAGAVKNRLKIFFRKFFFRNPLTKKQ
ncbi:MAG: dephospho-CoA kinase [Elusimicrobia bacterium]|nr:dephospho-CoA kinase [Elusimicrobiota bacterium]